MRESSDSRDYYSNFDWLRLVFAIQVVAIHCGLADHVLIAPVPAFLAVSGFVVLGSIQRRTIKDFYISRALRILPLLFLMFAVVAMTHGLDAMVKNITFWIWPMGNDLPENPAVWSLFYEEICYFLLTLLVVAGTYRTPWSSVAIFIAFAVITTLHRFEPLHAVWYVLGSAFFLGNVAYFFRDRISMIKPGVATILLIASTACVLTLPYMAFREMPYLWAHILSYGAMLIFAIAGPKLPRLAIDISYSLYIFHILVNNYVAKFIPLGWGRFALVLAACIPICLAAWFLVERPVNRLKRNWIGGTKSKTGQLTASMENQVEA